MLKIVDIVYHCHWEYNNPGQVLARHRPTLGFVEFIKDRVKYEVVRHMNYEGRETIRDVQYTFFKRKNRSRSIPFKTHRYIRSVEPDIVIIHGFIFPFQFLALRQSLGKNCIFVLQHHGDKPLPSVRMIFQKIADRFVDAYMFTSADIGTAWIASGVIKNKNKISEICAASVSAEKKDKLSCREKYGLAGNNNFLWVGRLNKNKDPLTVLEAFALHVSPDPSARLYMVYQTDELLPEVKNMIDDKELQQYVQLVGKLGKEELGEWYNAADFYISASHEEAAGYALMEAISVGCIPVVSSISSFKSILKSCSTAFMFSPGNVPELVNALKNTSEIDVTEYSKQTEKYFNDHLGFKNTADHIYEFAEKLIREKR